MMTRPLSTLLFVSALSTGLLTASAIPVASEKSALNLQHYLEYRSEGKITFSCEETPKSYRCLSKEQSNIEVDEDNSTTQISFKEAELRFREEVAPLLEKRLFQKTMDEIQKSEAAQQKDPDDGAYSTELEDDLDLALISDLDLIRIDMLDIKTSDPVTHTHLDTILYENKMSKLAKDVTFSKRIFGDITISYRNAVIDTDDSGSFYQTLPMMLEEWLETEETERAEYVGQRLNALYDEELSSPASGDILIQTSYLGNDAIALRVEAESANKHGASQSFKFSSEVRNISTLIQLENKELAAGTPDFLFKSMHSQGTTDGSKYRALLKSDKRFLRYMGEYDTLIKSDLDQKMKRYEKNTVVAGWFKQAKTAFSKLIEGKANTLEITVKNKNGVTAMQLFGMVMGQMMTMPSTPDDKEAGMEKLITDTAAQNLELQIKAR